MINIVVTFNGKKIHSFASDKDLISIGRHDGNDICLENAGVSMLHAKIYKMHGRYIIEDCNSKNGILLNNETVTTAEILNGDTVKIVKFGLSFSFKSARSGQHSKPAFDLPTTVKL